MQRYEIEGHQPSEQGSNAAPSSASNIPTQTRRVRGRPFERGNTYGQGRREGSRNRATIALQQLLDGEGEAITRKAIELALSGDSTALRLVLERLIPPARDRRIELELPPLDSLARVSNAMNITLQAVGQGTLTPAEGQAITGMLESHRKSLESTELEARIAALELQAKGQTRE